ncbi:MAG: vWA domain-containing protein [Nocardioides sp.]|jgi:hypothetical protein
MSHEQRIDRANPALIVILVDQSDSMKMGIAGTNDPKASVVAEQLNSLLYELVLRCVKTPREPPRPYFFVEVVGYQGGSGTEARVGTALRIPQHPTGPYSTTVLAQSPLRIGKQRNASTGAMVNMPVWIEPKHGGGTPMCAALDYAGRVCHTWVTQHPTAFPPIVINLSDGQPTDGDPGVWADRLRSLRTTDGEVLFFNVHISQFQHRPVVFPSTTDDLETVNAHRLFSMSSQLPPKMVDAARAHGLAVQPGSRGFAYNADLKSLAQFLNVGTSIGRIG